MNVIVTISDELAARLAEGGRDLERQALEGLVLEAYRSGRMTVDDVRNALGFEVLDQVDGFLKAHGAFEAYSIGDVERQVRTLVIAGV